MAVMNVRIVRMLVRHGLMPVKVRVRFVAIPVGIMRVLMMLIMRVRMGVFQQLMCMLMIMRFGQVQPYAQGHQRASPPEMSAR